MKKRTKKLLKYLQIFTLKLIYIKNLPNFKNKVFGCYYNIIGMRNKIISYFFCVPNSNTYLNPMFAQQKKSKSVTSHVASLFWLHTLSIHQLPHISIVFLNHHCCSKWLFLDHFSRKKDLGLARKLPQITLSNVCADSWRRFNKLTSLWKNDVSS